MAALVQSFPQSTSTVTMLQTRPSSSSGAFQAGSQSQQRGSGGRNVYPGASINPYRGPTSSTPVAPYAFTSTPALATSQVSATPHLRQENRTLSAPAGSPSSANQTSTSNKQRQLAPSPVLNESSDSGSRNEASSRLSILSQPLDLTLSDPRLTGANTAKPSPDRYRRAHRRSETSSAALGSQTTGGSAMPSGSGMATVGHLYNFPTQSASSPSFASAVSGSMVSKDDSAISRSSDQAKRYRRRSMVSIGNEEPVKTESRPQPPQMRSYASVVSTPYNPQKQDLTPINTNPPPPSSSHGRNNSDHSSASSSRPSSSKREGSSASGSPSPTVQQTTSIPKNEVKVVNIPPRASSDANKKIANPSPLSKPMSLSPESPVSQNSFAKLVQSKNTTPNPAPSPAPVATVAESPAAQQLAALTKKDGKKEGKSSRLRRAFSFGSAAELRKASAENSHASNERNKLKKPQFETEEEAREAAIVQQQEASGLGASIYSGQGNFFTGSTDNLSISSTASSASVMLRKMGKGVKKSTRSLVGLFRPKSVIGVPSADVAVPEPSVAQVSMVTVEAEREKVNVNVDPHDQAGGGTGFPRLERNSIDATSMSAREPSLTTSDRSSDNIKARRSIVGGEKERAEVLATIKKGILKYGSNSGSSSPVSKPADAKSPDFSLPPQLPRFVDSPHSSAPATPTDDTTPRGHRRNDSVTIEGEDYFMSVARFAGSETKSLPGTPRGMAKNISFSPRIQFHDTWTSTDYDRRGEIATCNRLTPTLAQAIKEELNSFKMEMEVHESSKVYTHFF